MVRVAGIEISNDKRIWVSLLGVYGIGEVSAKEICEKAGIDRDIFVKDLTEAELDKIRKCIEESYVVKGDFLPFLTTETRAVD